MIAPVARPGCRPWAMAIPIRATPIVPAVVHELPVLSATTAQITHAAG